MQQKSLTLPSVPKSKLKSTQVTKSGTSVLVKGSRSGCKQNSSVMKINEKFNCPPVCDYTSVCMGVCVCVCVCECVSVCV